MFQMFPEFMFQTRHSSIQWLISTPTNTGITMSQSRNPWQVNKHLWQVNKHLSAGYPRPLNSWWDSVHELSNKSLVLHFLWFNYFMNNSNIIQKIKFTKLKAWCQRQSRLRRWQSVPWRNKPTCTRSWGQTHSQHPRPKIEQRTFQHTTGSRRMDTPLISYWLVDYPAEDL